jgi:trimethylamine--corrinoid protein Co-methyltransferase
MESGVTAIIGALAGVNMISGAGMLDFLACQSAEKLVVDAEAIAMAKRLLAGIEVRTETLATAFFEGMNFKGDFLKQRTTRELFQIEQYLPSAIIDRNSVRGWQQDGSLDTFERAKILTTKLIGEYQRPQIDREMERELKGIVQSLAVQAGMTELPIPI